MSNISFSSEKYKFRLVKESSRWWFYDEQTDNWEYIFKILVPYVLTINDNFSLIEIYIPTIEQKEEFATLVFQVIQFEQTSSIEFKYPEFAEKHKTFYDVIIKRFNEAKLFL